MKQANQTHVYFQDEKIAGTCCQYQTTAYEAGTDRYILSAKLPILFPVCIGVLGLCFVFSSLYIFIKGEVELGAFALGAGATLFFGGMCAPIYKKNQKQRAIMKVVQQLDTERADNFQPPTSGVLAVCTESGQVVQVVQVISTSMPIHQESLKEEQANENQVDNKRVSHC